MDTWLAGKAVGIWFERLLSSPGYRNHISGLLNTPTATTAGLAYQGTESSFVCDKKHGDPAVKNPIDRAGKVIDQYPWLEEVLQMNEITSRLADAESRIMEQM
jgi:hypothetical protein